MNSYQQIVDGMAILEEHIHNGENLSFVAVSTNGYTTTIHLQSRKECFAFTEAHGGEFVDDSTTNKDKNDYHTRLINKNDGFEVVAVDKISNP